VPAVVQLHSVSLLTFRSFLCTVSVLVKSAKDLYSADAFGGKSDPYVVISVGDISAKTASKQNEVSPEFNETLTLVLSQNMSAGDELKIQVFDEDTLKDDSIGHAFMKLNEENTNGEAVWCDLVHGDGEKQGSVCVAVTTSLYAAAVDTESAKEGKSADGMTGEKTDTTESSPEKPSPADVESKDNTPEVQSASYGGAAPVTGEKSGEKPVAASRGDSKEVASAATVEAKAAAQAPQVEAKAKEQGDSAAAVSPAKAPNGAVDQDSDNVASVAHPAHVPESSAEETKAGQASPPSKSTNAIQPTPEKQAGPVASVQPKKATVEEIEAYLQTHVVPVLQEGLTQLAAVQPEKPLGWLAKYIALHAAAE